MKHKLFYYVVSVASSIGFVACDSSDITGDSVESSIRHEIELTSTQKISVEKANRFAFKLWDQINEAEINKTASQFFSPLSVQMAVSLLANGADTPLRNQIVSLYDDSEDGLEGLNKLNKIILNELPAIDSSVTICLANSMWCDTSLSFMNDFISDGSNYFKATHHTYQRGTEKAKADINDWCSINTKGMIDNFLSDPPESCCMLFNATYFNGNWKYRFDKSKTHKETFYCLDGTLKDVDMMTMRDYNVYGASNDKFVKVVLPYGNGGFKMTIMMPLDGVDFPESTASFFLDDIAWSLEGKTKVTMPRFEITRDYEVYNDLMLSGLSHINDDNPYMFENGNFKVSHVYQKNRCCVDEDGTEAASVTKIEGVGAVQPSQQTFETKINRSFLFTISETSTGLILFIGRMSDV